jgi:hypothetical protein
MIATETGVLDPRPKLLRLHMPSLATRPQKPIKRHGEGRERRFITRLRTWCGKRQSKHLALFSHLWGRDMSYRFK